MLGFICSFKPFRILEVMDLICWCTCLNSNIVTGLHFQLYRLGL
jgi:hypothetical protein